MATEKGIRKRSGPWKKNRSKRSSRDSRAVRTSIQSQGLESHCMEASQPYVFDYAKRDRSKTPSRFADALETPRLHSRDGRHGQPSCCYWIFRRQESDVGSVSTTISHLNALVYMPIRTRSPNDPKFAFLSKRFANRNSCGDNTRNGRERDGNDRRLDRKSF